MQGAHFCLASNGVPPTKSKRIVLDVNCMTYLLFSLSYLFSLFISFSVFFCSRLLFFMFFSWFQEICSNGRSNYFFPFYFICVVAAEKKLLSKEREKEEMRLQYASCPRSPLPSDSNNKPIMPLILNETIVLARTVLFVQYTQNLLCISRAFPGVFSKTFDFCSGSSSIGAFSIGMMLTKLQREAVCPLQFFSIETP